MADVLLIINPLVSTQCWTFRLGVSAVGLSVKQLEGCKVDMHSCMFIVILMMYFHFLK